MADSTATAPQAAREDPVYVLGRRLLQLRKAANKYDCISVLGRHDSQRASTYYETLRDAMNAVEATIGTTEATSLPGAAVQLMLLAGRLDIGEDLAPDERTWRELLRLCLSALRVVVGEAGVGSDDIPLKDYVSESPFPADYPECQA